LAAPGLWSVVAAARFWSRASRRAATIGLAGAAVTGALVSAALSVQAQRLFLFPSWDQRRDFVALQYRIDRALHDRPAPSASLVDEVGQVAARGTIEVLDGCRAVYWSDGSGWQAIEAGGDLRLRLRGRLLPGEVTVATGRGWAVVAATAGDEVSIRFEREDGPPLQGRPVARPRRGVDVVVELRLDPVNHQALVEVDGATALTAWLVPVDGARPGPGWEPAAAPMPLCDDLVASLRR
jgi:hypothetical protein